MIDGLGEVIKYGCIKDAELFDKLEQYGTYEVLKEHMEEVIATCVDIKRRVVEEDEFDLGERLLLNFGHTLAHAIEQYYHYERESHGEAERIRKVLEMYKLPVTCGINVDELKEAMKSDKKNLDNKLKVVLIKEIGKAYVYPTNVEFFGNDSII